MITITSAFKDLVGDFDYFFIESIKAKRKWHQVKSNPYCKVHTTLVKRKGTDKYYVPSMVLLVALTIQAQTGEEIWVKGPVTWHRIRKHRLRTLLNLYYRGADRAMLWSAAKFLFGNKTSIFYKELCNELQR